MVEVSPPPGGVLPCSVARSRSGVENHLDTSPKARPRLVSRGPQWLEDAQNVLSCDRVDGLVPERRGILSQGHSPCGPVGLAAPAGLLRLYELIGEGSERGYRTSNSFALCDWIRAGRTLLAAVNGQIASHRQRNRGEAPEAHLSQPAVLAEQEGPTLRATFFDDQIKAAAIRVASGLRDRLHCARRESIDLPRHHFTPTFTLTVNADCSAPPWTGKDDPVKKW